MKRRLSSMLTPLYKLIFLSVLSGVLYRLTNGFRSSDLPGLAFLSFWCAIWYVLTHRWKSVYLAGGTLYVSSYLKKVEIPLSEVKEIKASSWWGRQPRTITMTLKSRSEFGDRIVFVPRGAGFGASEVEQELKRLLAR